jgi:hypothetical protein
VSPTTTGTAKPVRKSLAATVIARDAYDAEIREHLFGTSSPLCFLANESWTNLALLPHLASTASEFYRSSTVSTRSVNIGKCKPREHGFTPVQLCAMQPLLLQVMRHQRRQKTPWQQRPSS